MGRNHQRTNHGIVSKSRKSVRTLRPSKLFGKFLQTYNSSDGYFTNILVCGPVRARLHLRFSFWSKHFKVSPSCIFYSFDPVQEVKFGVRITRGRRCSLFFGNRRDVPLGRLGDPLTQLSTTCSFPIQPVPLRSRFTCSYENLCEKERITEYLVPLYPHHLLPATVSAGYAFDVCMSAVPHFPDWYFVSGWKLLQQQQPGIPHQWFIPNGLSSNLRLFFCLDFFPRRCRRL